MDANVSVRVNEGLDVVYITALSSKTTGRACGVWLGAEKLREHVESRVGVGARVHLGALVTLDQKPYEGFVYELHKVDVLPDGPLRAGRGAPAAAPVGTSKNAKKRAKKRARNEDLAHENADLKAELARRDDAARLDKKHRTNETRVASSGRRVDVDFEFVVTTPQATEHMHALADALQEKTASYEFVSGKDDVLRLFGGCALGGGDERGIIILRAPCCYKHMGRLVTSTPITPGARAKGIHGVRTRGKRPEDLQPE